MISPFAAVEMVLARRANESKPLCVVLAGHNGSGKSTMWREHLSAQLQIPLVNADRMMLSILPEPEEDGRLIGWASKLRDNNQNWMAVAQKGVEAFVSQAMARQVPFAMETVFSHWVERSDGTIESKIDLIRQMQAAGYYVLLCFVGLSSAAVSVARVLTRIGQGGHDVNTEKLEQRFPRTQIAIRAASMVADATILVDNSRDKAAAFTVCRIQLRDTALFDLRQAAAPPPPVILAWLGILAPP